MHEERELTLGILTQRQGDQHWLIGYPSPALRSVTDGRFGHLLLNRQYIKWQVSIEKKDSFFRKASNLGRTWTCPWQFPSAKTIFKGKQSQLIIKPGGQILCHFSIATSLLTPLCLPWDIVLLKWLTCNWRLSCPVVHLQVYQEEARGRESSILKLLNSFSFCGHILQHATH